MKLLPAIKNVIAHKSFVLTLEQMNEIDEILKQKTKLKLTLKQIAKRFFISKTTLCSYKDDPASFRKRLIVHTLKKQKWDIEDKRNYLQK